MFQFKISTRIYLLVALFLLSLGLVTYMSIKNTTSTRADTRDAELQSIAESAISVIAGEYARAQAGEITEQQAQDSAKRTVSQMRYRGAEYLFINDFNGIMVMNPLSPQLVGTDRSQIPDKNGKLFQLEMMNGAKTNGSGFVDYAWTRPGSDAAVDKRSYYAAFKPWSWIVGTGVYVDDLRAQAFQDTVEQGGIAAVIVGIMMLVAFLISRTITGPIQRLTATMGRIAGGEFSETVAGQDRKDELGAMARAVEVFRENGLKVAHMTEQEAASIVRNQAERTKMMADLQVAFGNVVDAAIAGDFSKRVNATFPDEELNTLAGSVNNLVETVDRGLGETGDVLSALADTDLTRRVQGAYEGAFAKLKTDTNAVADKLTDIVGQLRDTSRTLKTATGEILSGANDLSERTTKQAATIEETSAAMEQLAVTVMDNAKKAEDASVKAGVVSKSAEAGGEVMAQATVAMERITTSSSKISNIIGMIDDIAFQTNLLALNASVEAARAGEAGKGFAVVAIEVRRLAQSAAQASSEVKQLIEQSANEVSGGSKLVADAAGKLAAMLEAVKENNMLLDGIARASREQASSIEEVNTAVRTMDEMTQHNAALVEEINAAIEQTETQASELDRVVDIFTIDEHGKSVRVAAVAPRAANAGGIKGLQQRVKSAAKSYLSHGNAAIDKDWAEF